MGRSNTFLLLVATGFFPPQLRATVLHATTANFAATFSGAAGGDTILLATGNYGYWTGGTSKSTTVTISPESGATVTIGLNFSSGPHHLNLDGSGGTMNIGGSDAQLTGAHDITVQHCVFTNPIQVDTTINGANLLFDYDTFDNLGQGTYEGRFSVRGYSNSSAVGVVISHSHFAGGCSDGIQIIGGAYGVVVGPGNEFTGINQSGCDPVHVDPIQFYGDSHTTVTGNWFHDNGSGSGGIMTPDNSPNGTITNNVFASTGYAYALMCGGCTNYLVEHNTVNASQSIHFATGNDGTTSSSGNTLRNNILRGGSENQGTTVTFNMYPSGASGSNFNGTPTFTGGATPSTYAGYALTSGSTGHLAGSDGADVGVQFGVASSASARLNGKVKLNGKAAIR